VFIVKHKSFANYVSTQDVGCRTLTFAAGLRLFKKKPKNEFSFLGFF
jgi:hypothetical protein